MLFCDKIFNKGSEQTKLTYKRALIIGFIQCIAMIPGVSRSMSTIVGGMSQRLTRKAAAEFSFFLAVPTMFGATCLEVYKLISHGGGSLLTQGNNLFTLILGSVVAFIVAILAIKFSSIMSPSTVCSFRLVPYRSRTYHYHLRPLRCRYADG